MHLGSAAEADAVRRIHSMTTTPTAPALAALRRRATDRPAEVRAWITAQSLAVQRELGYGPL